MVSKEVKDSLITYGTMAAIAFLFSGVSDGKHERDIFGVHLEYLKKSSDKLWDMKDYDLMFKPQEVKENYEYRLAEKDEKIKDLEHQIDLLKAKNDD